MRSAFVRNALDLYLRAKQRRDVDDAIRRAYAGKSEELIDDISGLIEAQAWPSGTKA